MKLTNDQIYKMYKHGESLVHNGLTVKRIYNALLNSGLQVVMVEDVDGNPIIYNYVPEIHQFHHVYE